MKVTLPDGRSIEAEVADSAEAQRTGLLKYRAMRDDQAMLFPYLAPTDVTFHTRGMSFPIDILFLSRVGGKTAAGASAGSMDIASTPLTKAREHAEELFQQLQGMSLDQAIPNFDSNYLAAQGAASAGSTQRVDMPVIEDYQVKEYQQRIANGYIDIREPFAPETEPSNPFPEGLTGAQAGMFMENGLMDMNDKDDVVSVSGMSQSAKSLKPIQRQIYYDKSITKIASAGVGESASFLRGSFTICSADGYIIDGHHRWLSAMLIDPNIQMNGIKVDLPINKLLPLATAYGDAIGNARNAQLTALEEAVIGYTMGDRAKVLRDLQTGAGPLNKGDIVAVSRIWPNMGQLSVVRIGPFLEGAEYMVSADDIAKLEGPKREIYEEGWRAANLDKVGNMCYNSFIKKKEVEAMAINKLAGKCPACGQAKVACNGTPACFKAAQSESAAETYKVKLVELRSLVKRFEQKLDQHERDQAAEPKNWGYPGDVGHWVLIFKDSLLQD